MDFWPFNSGLMNSLGTVNYFVLILSNKIMSTFEVQTEEFGRWGIVKRRRRL